MSHQTPVPRVTAKLTKAETTVEPRPYSAEEETQ